MSSAPASAPIVTFLSDFGVVDWFVGVVHGVINQICPAAHVIDLNHACEPGDVERAAFLLEAAAADFPPRTVHLAVVDPGVGTERRALAVSAHGQTFVGPDNGLLEWAFLDREARVHALENPSYFRHPVSRTFHGRDVFGPVAAHIAAGVALEAFGPQIVDPARLERPAPHLRHGELRGRIAYIDRFGNALTNVTAEALARAFPNVSEERLEVEIVDRRIAGIARSYGDAPIGTLIVIMGSSGRLEVAQVGGHAAMRFGIGVHDRILVRER
jgi:S-adenosylmethionine hydrolase